MQCFPGTFPIDGPLVHQVDILSLFAANASLAGFTCVFFFLERFVTVWTFYYNAAPRTGDICLGLTKFAVRDTRFSCLCRYYEDYF